MSRSAREIVTIVTVGIVVSLCSVLMFVWVMTLTHNDQEREIKKIDACKATQDVGVCIQLTTGGTN